MKKWWNILPFFLLACEEPIDAPLNIVDSDVLVVEGLLTNQKINHLIKLSHPHTQISGDPIPATGARAGIFIDGELTYLLQENPEEPGYYYSEPFRAVFGQVYVLGIEYQGQQYFAFDASAAGEPLPAINLEQVNESFYRLNRPAGGFDPNYINHDIYWDQTSFCEQDTLCEGKVVFYDLKTTDVHEIYKPDKTDFIFPVGSVIVRTKFSVNENYRTFLRSVLSETSWRGGYFDIQRANAPTNLSEGAIGYFAVSTVVSDTIVVE
ncbi:MAG: DUF4249 family protein [Cyclobacteriaceae bacterium]